jgi:hypothetical protein
MLTPSLDVPFFVSYNKPEYPEFVRAFYGACEQCAQLEPSKWRFCTHTSGTDPVFKSKQSKQKWGKIYELIGMVDAHLREDYGIITSKGEPCFTKEALDWLFNKNNFIEPPAIYVENAKEHIPFVFACIDPNGGGMNNAAITIGYRDTNTGQIVVSI